MIFCRVEISTLGSQYPRRVKTKTRRRLQCWTKFSPRVALGSLLCFHENYCPRTDSSHKQKLQSTARAVKRLIFVVAIVAIEWSGGGEMIMKTRNRCTMVARSVSGVSMPLEGLFES